MIYEEKLQEARRTGEGIATRFQEEANYKMANGLDCPHCGAYHGYKKDDEGKIIYEKDKVSTPYEIPSDIEWMCNNTGYSWTEDVKCASCENDYSQSNGC